MRRDALGTKTKFKALDIDALEANSEEAAPRDNRPGNSRLLGGRQYRRWPVDRSHAQAGDRRAASFSERNRERKIPPISLIGEHLY